MDKNKTSHILVIRLSAMGDVAMTVPVLSAFCHQYPEISVTVLTKGFFGPMFAQLPNVEVYEADVKGKHKGITGLWKLYRELGELNITAVADLHNVLRSNILKQFFVFAGFQVAQIDKGRSEKRALTGLKNKIFKPLKTTHQRYADVCAQLGFPINLSKSPLLKKEPLSEKALEIVPSKKEKWIGIAPFAAFKGKVYPINLMEEVVQSLNNTKEYKILLFGGGTQEKTQLKVWESQFENCISIAGKLSFAEELSVISNLELMLSMDSGNGHLAAMYDVPVITMWGTTHPYAGFYPFRQHLKNALLSDRQKYPLIPTSVYGNKVPKGYDTVMRTIPPETVVSKIKEVLSYIDAL